MGSWEKQLASFAERYRVVAPDLRGHGLSDHPRSRLPPRSMPQAIEFRQELPKPFVGKEFKRKLLEQEDEQRLHASRGTGR